MNEMTNGYLVVTDYIPANSGKDVSDELQALILNNPHKTFFFPDGEYLLSKPVDTPANPKNAVSLKLATFAIIAPTEDWQGGDEALIRLGAAEPFNDIGTPGSNYGVEGGCFDGRGRANGISIDSGRETFIRNLSIKNTRLGIYIKRGANNGSSDADVRDVNIVGTNSADSVGVLVVGYDNTIANMRIASVHTGVEFRSGGNCISNVHPLYIFGGDCREDEVYKTSCAFRDICGNNWYENCYSDQFAIGFWSNESRRVYNNCFAMWYTNKGEDETGFYFEGRFNCIIRSATVSLRGDANATFMKVTEKGGSGIVENPIFNKEACKTDDYMDYLVGKVIW